MEPHQSFCTNLTKLSTTSFPKNHFPQDHHHHHHHFLSLHSSLLSLLLTDWAGSDRLMSDSPEDIAARSILMVLVNFQWSQVIKRPGSIPLVTQLGQPSLGPQCDLWGGERDGDPDSLTTYSVTNNLRYTATGARPVHYSTTQFVTKRVSYLLHRRNQYHRNIWQSPFTLIQVENKRPVNEI